MHRRLHHLSGVGNYLGWVKNILPVRLSVNMFQDVDSWHLLPLCAVEPAAVVKLGFREDVVLNEENAHVWVFVLEVLQEQMEVCVLVRHDDLVNVIQQHILGLVHVSVDALIKSGQLTIVMDVPPVLFEVPASGGGEELVYRPFYDF